MPKCSRKVSGIKYGKWEEKEEKGIGETKNDKEKTNKNKTDAIQGVENLNIYWEIWENTTSMTLDQNVIKEETFRKQ